MNLRLVSAISFVSIILFSVYCAVNAATLYPTLLIVFTGMALSSYGVSTYRTKISQQALLVLTIASIINTLMLAASVMALINYCPQPQAMTLQISFILCLLMSGIQTYFLMYQYKEKRHTTKNQQ